MYVKCTVCGGKGADISTSPAGWRLTIQCNVCCGKGGFDIPDGTHLCLGCKGRGKKCVIQGGWPGRAVHVDCEFCDGKGYQEAK